MQSIPAPVLNPWIALVYMSMHIIMVLYPISVLRPEWLTPRHFTYLFLPTLILAIVYASFIGKWTPLESTAAISAQLGAPDVLARLAAPVLMFPYCFLLFLLPYNYRHTSATFWWIVTYSLGLLLLCTVHLFLMLTNSPVLLITLPILAATFYCLSSEYELEERIRPGAKEQEAASEASQATAETVSAPAETDLWARICHLMDQDEVWRNPDLSLSGMARLCATNVTYLSRTIQQETGTGFKEYVNAKRIACVAAQLREHPETDIQEAFFNAGYRSRTTAWRNFKEIMGATPTNYLQSQK